MKTRLLFLLTLVICAAVAHGQNHAISGKVVSSADNEPLIGASVLIKGTTNGTITDFNGVYKLSASPNSTLVISYVGYVTQEIPINGKSVINITLNEDSKAIDDIVVIGYGTQKKADLSSSIAVLDTKELGKLPGGLSAGLQSSVAGVQVTDGKIRIRGVGTINSTDPLYVVDGLIGGSAPDESQIESIQVLKDAASCAIYGARGANGVIMITTKRGSTGKVKVEYDGFVGWKWLSHNVDMLTGQELAELINEATYNAYGYDASNYLEALSDPASIGKGYDMFKALTQTAFYQKHNVSIGGGNDNATFRVNLNYNTDEPVTIKEKYENYSMQFISDFKKGILKMGESMTFSRNDANWSDYYLLAGQKWSSTCPIYDDTNEWGYAGATNGTDVGNPLAEANMNWDKSEANSVKGNLWASLDILPGLTYKFNMGIDVYRYTYEGYDQEYVIGYSSNDSDDYSLAHTKTNRFVYENTLSYDKVFGKHSISALFGVTSEETKGKWFSAGASSFPASTILDLDTTQDEDSKTVSSSTTRSSMFSILARVNYSYDSKYLFTFNFRRDGSSNFSKSNRYGNFPSVSAAWRISKEKFMSKLDWLDDLKIRASWGMIGNSDIDPYQYQTTIGFSNLWYYLGSSSSKVTGALPSTPSNPDVKWETQYSTDVGFDLTVLNQRLTFTFDYYYKKTKDMLLEVPISYSVGYGSNQPTLNAGSVRNKGFEFALTYRDHKGHWDWSVSANLSTVRNKVLDLGENSAIYAANTVTKTAVGSSIGMFYGYVTDGLFKSDEEVQAYVNSDGELLQPDAEAGDIRFVDVNGDGTIDDNDKTYIGNPLPDFTYGLSADASLRTKAGTFDFAMIWQGSQGNDIFNYSRVEMEGMYHYYGQQATTLDRFRAEDLYFTNPISGVVTYYPANTDTDIPRAVIGDPNNNTRLSDRYIEDGSYLRLKALTIGWTLPNQWLNKWGIDKLRFYVGAKNLLTFTSYSGYDPEVGDQDSSGNLTRGVDGMSIYDPTFPNSREFFMGLQLTF